MMGQSPEGEQGPSTGGGGRASRRPQRHLGWGLRVKREPGLGETGGLTQSSGATAGELAEKVGKIVGSRRPH